MAVCAGDNALAADRAARGEFGAIDRFCTISIAGDRTVAAFGAAKTLVDATFGFGAIAVDRGGANALHRGAQPYVLTAIAPCAIGVVRYGAKALDDRTGPLLFAARRGFAVVAAGLTNAIDHRAAAHFCANFQICAVIASCYAIAQRARAAGALLDAAIRRFAVGPRRRTLPVHGRALAEHRTRGQRLTIIAVCHTESFRTSCAKSGSLAAIRGLAIVAGRFADALVERALAKFGASLQNFAVFARNGAVFIDHAAQPTVDARRQCLAIIASRDAVAIGLGGAGALDLATFSGFAVIANSCAFAADHAALAILGTSLQDFAVIASGCAVAIGIWRARALVFATGGCLAVVAHRAAMPIHRSTLAELAATFQFLAVCVGRRALAADGGTQCGILAVLGFCAVPIATDRAPAIGGRAVSFVDTAFGRRAIRVNIRDASTLDR